MVDLSELAQDLPEFLDVVELGALGAERLKEVAGFADFLKGAVSSQRVRASKCTLALHAQRLLRWRARRRSAMVLSAHARSLACVASPGPAATSVVPGRGLRGL